MRHTIKDISEGLFDWLAKLMLADSDYYPEQIKRWSDCDWKVARTIVFIHGMGPLWGSRCLQGWQCEFMPVSFRDYLVQQYRKNSIRIKKIQLFYQDISEKLTEQGIRFIPFKGVHLISQIYSDPGVRPMADIDLFVGAANREKVCEILHQFGLSPSEVNQSGATFFPQTWLNGVENKQIRTHQNTVAIIDLNDPLFAGEDPDSPFSIDIHFDMKPRCLFTLFDLTHYFEGAISAHKAHLSNEIYFIYLLLHAAKHLLTRSGRWLHLYDIYLFQKKYSVDLSLVAKKSAELKAAYLLLLSLKLCQTTFAFDSLELESMLQNQIGWRHKLLLRNNHLSEMSCCNPWEVNHWSLLVRARSIKDIGSWLVAAKNRSKNTWVRKGRSLVSVPSIGSRILSRIKQLIFKKARGRWNMLAAHGLDPRLDWK